MKQTLGERIAEKRRAKGLTQEELAAMLGVSAQAVSKWENDISCPDIMTLPPLADRLGVSVDELLRGSNEESRTILLSKEERRDFDKLMLRIKIDDTEGDKVRVNLPLPLIKTLIDSGVSIETFGGNATKGLNIDWDTIVSLIDSGVIGCLMEAESANGETVRIVVE